MLKKIKYIALLIVLVVCSISVIHATTSTSDDKNINQQTNSDFLLKSPLFTSPEKNVEYNPKEVNNIEEGFVKVYDNNEVSLYIDQDSLAFRLYNKQTRYTWASDILSIDDYSMNNAQKKYARSSFEYYYRTADGVIKKRYTTDRNLEKSYTIENNKIVFKIDDTKSSIRFSYYLQLEGTKLKVHLENKSIEEYGDNKITQISFFQYFGSVYKDSIDGYFFIPSGNGGLVRFNEFSALNSSYTSRFYGSDFNRVQNREDETLTMPIYGYAHYPNHNAALIEVTGGSPFAELTYTPSNTGKNFNMLYTSFLLRESYVLSIPGSDSILTIPEDYYKSDMELTFDFLSGDNANYVGMANKYKENLISRGDLTKKEYTNNVHLDFFGQDTSKGLLFKQNHKMTTTSDIKQISNDFKEQGIDKILYTLRGFNKGGFSALSASNYSFDGGLGRLGDLKGLDYYMYYNPTESYSDTRKANSNTLVDVYNTRGIIEIEESTKYKLISNMDYSSNYSKKAIKKYPNLALDGFDNYLYGDSDNNYTREKSLEIIKNTFEDINIPMFKPNDYFFNKTKDYLNMDLYHDRLRFITDSVPFLQIVLSGYVPYYSTYLNFSANSQLDVLKCIESGTYPSYLLTQEESHNLSKTLSSNLYGTTYNRLSNDMFKNIKFINKALDEVVGNEIVKREVLSDGIVLTTYSNNKSILLNYTSSSYTYNNKDVSSMNYEVIK